MLIDSPAEPIRNYVITALLVRLLTEEERPMVTRTLHKPPLAWPFKVLGWFVVLAVGLAVAAGAAVIGASTYYEMTRTKAGDIEGMIDTKLRAGATADEVVALLDSERIEHGPVLPSSGDDRKLQEMGIPTGTMTVAAFVENDGYSLDLVDVEMRFIFDQELRLVNHVVYEVHHRP